MSLEQLLAEGRNRPATFAGNVALPHADEIEELGAEELLDAPVAVAVMDEPAPVAAAHSLEARIAVLERQLQVKQAALQTVLRELDELRARVSTALNALD